jgi:peptide/nickel transport system ATP-binding protein
MSNLISVRDLRVSFRLGKTKVVEAVKGVSFDVPENSTVALVGESGSGKSVSAMSIVRLLPENAIVGPQGRVEFGGKNLLTEPVEALRKIRGKDISVVFQEPMTSLNPVFTVGDQIAEVLQLHLGLSRKQTADRVLELMTEVGIPEPKARVDAYPHELSGGQQQRVMIAMAIACEPKLLIADEPTTALDVTVQRQILDLIAKLQTKHRMSVLFISHDLGVVGEIADRVVVMREGTVREASDVASIFAAPQDAYTKALLACRPRLDVKPKRLPVIDDFMKPAGANGMPIVVTERRMARASEPKPLIEAVGLRKEYRLKTGLFARKTVEAVKEASFTLSRGRTLGRGGRVRLGQDDDRHAADAADRRHRRQRHVRRQGPAVAVGGGDDGVPPPHPDHLPEPVREPEPALHDRPDTHRADAYPRHRYQRGRPFQSGGGIDQTGRPVGRCDPQVPA